TVATAYSQSLAATGGTLPYGWTLLSGTLPDGLTLSSTGTISGTPTTAGTANFTLRATDASIPTPQTADKALSIVINPAALAVTTTTLPAGTVATAYSQSLAATGGTLPYGWTLLSGTLPDGLTLSSTGTINGTPTTAGTANFTVRATDASTPMPQTADKALSIVINAAALAVTTTTLPAGTVATAYSQSLAATGGTLPYVWTLLSGTLPDGLTLSSTGTINGTPTTAGTANFTVRATDASTPMPQTADKALSIVINAAALAV